MTLLLRVSRSLSKLLKTNNFIHASKSLRAASTSTEWEDVELNVPPLRITTLNSGIRIATEDWASQTATIGIWVNAGSRSEFPKDNGVVNFLTRMAFKGTSKRSRHQLEAEIEEMGAQLSAYATREFTVYYAKCMFYDVPQIIDILADIIKNTKFNAGELQGEKGRLLKEMEGGALNLEEATFNYLHAIAYQGTPLGRTVKGTTKSVRCVESRNLEIYSNCLYTAKSIVVVGVGGVYHAQFAASVDCSFGSFCRDSEPPALTPCRYTGSEVRVRDDSLPLAHVAIAVESPGWADPDIVPLAVASTLLGRWDKQQALGRHSALALARYSDEYKLCHAYRSFHKCYSDTGLWGVYFVSDPLTIDDMLCNVQYEFMRLCTSVTEGEVERARSLLVTNTLLQLSNTTDVFEDIGRQMIYTGNRVPPDELIDCIKSVTVAKLRSTCYKYFYDRCPVVAAIGPVEQLPDYNRVRNNMYWLRV